jgi:UDP-N-acetylglucosamine acyltransferase
MSTDDRQTVQIHPTALVEQGARLRPGCVIHPYAVIRRHCEIGENVTVHPFAVVGGDPQDLNFQATTESGVRVGPGSVIREHVTISRATKAGAYTEIGSDCFLMAACHIAHDCRIGDRVVIANAVLLAGHVQVGHRAFLGGGAVIHQYCRVGDGVMVGGGARISRDIAPFTLATERNALIGLNVVGMRRRGLNREALDELKRAYRQLDVAVGNLRLIAADALASGRYATAEARLFLEFFQYGRRGFARSGRSAADSSEDDSAA